MQLYKNEYPVIEAANPWRADKLDRKQVADALTPIIASVSQPFVIAIESPYGMGKSVFLECWGKQLNGDGIKAIKFDAWKTDFSHEALPAFMTCLKRELPQDKVSEAGNSVLAAGKKIMKATAVKLPGVIIKAVARGALGEGASKDLLDGLSLDSDDVADLGQQVVDQALDIQARAEAGLDEFRASLTEWVGGLPSPPGTNVKLVILVDELDRCRPSYAIQVLECIKHLFTVPGIVFVLAVDWRVLCGAVAGTYGAEIDADGYLKKFVDWRYRLPDPQPAAFARHLRGRFSLDDLRKIYTKVDSDTLDRSVEVFATASAALKLTLREQEHAFTQFNLTVRTATAQQSPYLVETAFLAAYCSRHRALVEELIMTNTASQHAADKVLDLMRGSTFFGEREEDLAILQGWFINSREHERLTREMQTAPPGVSEERRLNRALRISHHQLYNVGGTYSIVETVMRRMRLIGSNA
jgi:hypothetical protein